MTSDLILINKYVAESIKQLIAGHLVHIGLRQLCKTEDAAVLCTVDKGLCGQNILQSFLCLIDIATHLFIQIDSLDMLLYYYSILYCTILYTMLYYNII